MSSKKRNMIIIVICLLLIIFNSIFVYFLASPSITLNGKKEIVVGINEEYVEVGAYASFLGNDLSKDVKIDGTVDTTKRGTYNLTYTFKKGFVTKETSRTVIVKDLEAPTIELKGSSEALVCPGKDYVEEGYTAIDDVMGDITDNVTTTKEDEKIIYSVSDEDGNKATNERTIKYGDEEAPKITLKDGNSLNYYVTESFKDPGYTVSDNCDGDLASKVKVSGSVDTSKIGKYTLNYEVTDSAGNKTTINRVVNVTEKPKGGVVYLTFDDGPGQYTQEILNILARNNVKATFFVTNQFPKYQDMIKKEHEAGHTVAVHTYSHSWSVYDSLDNYINDFNKMNEIVYKQTGSYSKYFRFPGGSSNTVSKKHKTGVVTEIANYMTNKGYVYFDWNVDCGDTHANNTVNYIVNNIKKYVKGEGSYIILMHDIKKNTLNALPSIINYLKSMNYTFKAIDDGTPVKHFKIAN